MNRATPPKKLIIGIAVVLLIAIGVWAVNRSRVPSRIVGEVESTRNGPLAEQTPPVDNNTPMENTTPMESGQPKLVGRLVCQECHADNFKLHAKHGHASTFHLVPDTDIAARFDGKSYDAGQPYGTYEYQSEGQGRLSVTLRAQFGDEPFPLQYALGSGQNAQTMLTLTTDKDGQTEGIEHRVSCYPDGRIDLTPGHSRMKPGTALEFFGNAARGEPLQRCIYCHTTSGTIVKEQINDLVPNVNCEKCHGPGSQHVRQARGNAKPPPFSVGRDDWDTESELQLCGDCHRLPRSVTEKEMREYPDLMVRFQPVGLLQSRCYLQSNHELRCTTCHNPHATLHGGDKSEQVKNCVNCHQTTEPTHVACPVSPETGCIECHMPAIETDKGLRFHDHWIRIHP